MGRKKVKLAFIVNDSARKATYNKRKKGLLKKVDELSTLCGIEACAVVYSPYDTQPEVWPSPQGVQSVVSKFTMMPEQEQNKKMVNQEIFLKQRIMKAGEKLKKQMKENKQQDMTMFMFQCLATGKIVDDNMPISDLNELSWLIEQNLKDIDRRMETLDKNAHIVAPSHVHMAPPAPTQGMARNEEMVLRDPTPGLGMNADTMQRSWFMDSTTNGNGDGEIRFRDVNL